MSTTIPSRDISIEDKKLFRERTIAAGIWRAKTKGIAVDDMELKWRDLAPEDVGLTAWATPATRAGEYTTWITHLVSMMSALCIYKVLQLSNNPTVASMRFLVGSGTVKGIHELEACYSGLPIIKNLAKALMSPEAKEVLDRLAGRDEMGVSPDLGSPMEAYFGEPYVYDPQDQVIIQVKSRQDSPGDYLVLGGYVIERIGVTIV